MEVDDSMVHLRVPYAIPCVAAAAASALTVAEVLGGHQGHGLTREQECRGPTQMLDAHAY